MSKDPLPFLQRYAYAANNPATFIDPSGRCPFLSLGAFADYVCKAAGRLKAGISKAGSYLGRAATPECGTFLLGGAATLAGWFEVPGANNIAIATYGSAGTYDLLTGDQRAFWIDSSTTILGSAAQGGASLPGIGLIASAANTAATAYAAGSCIDSIR